jgi:hypothetical protein
MSRFEVVWQVATPVVEFTVAGLVQETAVPPTVKVTVPVGPVGVIAPGDATLKVAVNVTAVLRAADEVGEMVSTGLALVMTWLTVVAFAAVKLTSPG